jgi:molybdenum cofactor cytidylyltransferase
VPAVLAVVRPAAPALEQVLRKAGCEVSVCDAADQGMAASLVHALETVRAARGWIVALGDMPHVQPSTTQALASALEQGAQIAVPVHQGRRGNPVAFGAALLPELLQLRGDEGARRLLHRFPVIEVAVDDAGIFRDIDTADDLAR